MKYIKLFDSYLVKDFDEEEFFKNIEDILVELRDDGLFTKVFTYVYTTEWLDKHSKNLKYFHKGSMSNLSNFVKEECTLLTIYIGKDSEEYDTEFNFKESYNSCFEMLNDYIKEFYKLEYDDIFYIKNNSTIHKGDWLSKIDGEKIVDLRISFILPIGSVKSDNKRTH
jgi:hypothetical protein